MRLLAVLSSLLLALPSAAQLRRLDVRAIDRAVVAMMKAFDVPGAAVAIVQNDRVIHVAGYGTTELNGTEPVGPDTLFQIASTSKAFTSTALAMLVAEKKLSWDDPVRKYIPYFRLSDLCADSEVTVRDIVTHRTGLSRHDELWDNTPLTREDVLRSVEYLELSKPFRSAYQYQNIMFIAAGEVVAAASGMSWDEFVRTRIFKPLGMTGTVTSDSDWNAAHHATGYRHDWKTGVTSAQKPIETMTLGSAGAIKSSARDMAQWLRFQLDDGVIDGVRLIDAEVLDETKTPHTVIRLEDGTRDANPESNLLSYAMGWNVQDYRGELVVSHGGALNGFRTQVGMMPKRDFGYAIMINVGRGYGGMALRNTLIDLLTGKLPRDWNAYYLMVERKANEKADKELIARLAKRDPASPPSRPLTAYAGEFVSPSHGVATVTLSGDTLELRWQRLVLPLDHIHHDVFEASSKEGDVEEEVTFSLSAQGQVTGLTLFGAGFRRK